MADYYRDIRVEAITLYSVSRISHRDSGYTVMKYPLRTQLKLSASVVENVGLGIFSLSSTMKLSGMMFDKHTGSTIVGWSDIGNADFSINRKNIAGQMYMDWQGQVYKVKKLDNSVMVYGSGGVTRLPIAGAFFGKQEVLGVGIKGRDCIAGTDKIHYFIDQFGDLWSLGSSIKKIGGKIHFASMAENTVLSFLESSNELIISDSSKAFKVYCDTEKITEWEQITTGIGVVKENVFIASPSITTLAYAEYISHIMDFQSPGLKTIQSLEVLADNPDAIECSIYYSDNKNDWEQTPWGNAWDGVYKDVVTAKFFKLAFRVLIGDDVGHIDAVAPAIQYSDRRNYNTTPKIGVRQ